MNKYGLAPETEVDEEAEYINECLKYLDLSFSEDEKKLITKTVKLFMTKFDSINGEDAEMIKEKIVSLFAIDSGNELDNEEEG